MAKRNEKARRAQLRKAAGLKRYSEIYAERAARRPANQIVPTRRGPIGIAYACFECRKSFKKLFATDQTYKCPQCANDLAEMGKAFKAPKRSETKQWQKVQRLWTAGYRFRANTTRQHIPPYPSSLREVEDWIRENPTHPFRLRDYWP